MNETLSELFVADRGEAAVPAAEAGSFLDLLSSLEGRSVTSDRGDIIGCYKGWIERSSPASAAVYAAWFNLGVELAAAGDKAGASNAYQNALALRPGFYPAAINLGTTLEFTGQPEAALAVWQQALQPEEARASLLEHRDRLAEAWRIEQSKAAKVLHIGYPHGGGKLPPVFRGPAWREIRVDIDPRVQPDFVASPTDLHVIADGLADAVYSPHAIQHLFPHEVPLALREMLRVLTPAGFSLVTLPDLQEVARHVAAGRLEDPLYMSAAGPIAPLDILYGHRPSVASGTASVTPRTGFTSTTLGAALIKAGFAAVMVQRDPSACGLTAIAFRSKPDQERLAWAQAQILPAADHPAVLYTPAG